MPTITQAVVDEFKRVAEWSDEKKLWVYREDRWCGGGCAGQHAIKRKGDKIGGSSKSKYYAIRIFSNVYKLHRLAYCVYHNTVISDRDIIDHANMDKKDNSIDNIRLATMSQNQMNKPKRGGCSSIYKGVSWFSGIGKWYSCISIKGKQTRIGFFDDEASAALAYNAYAIEHHKEFANLNIIYSNLK